MKLLFSKKTWYALLLLAAALGMADGFAMLAGQNYSLLENVSFGACGLAALFLAAEKQPEEKSRAANPYSGWYFACFVALLASYILFGGVLAVHLTVFWPLLVLCEVRRGKPLTQQLRLLIFIEILQAAALICVHVGLAGFQLWAIIFWILVCTARGWAALVLYQTEQKPRP